MDAREKNKIKCKEYYLKTKDNLSEEVKAKRKKQANERQKRFYNLNKELCKLRMSLYRYNSIEKKSIVIDKISKFSEKITEKEIKFIKNNNINSLIKKAPRLKMWDKKIESWTFKDFNKLINLI